jgi:hypothetical protein
MTRRTFFMFTLEMKRLSVLQDLPVSVTFTGGWVKCCNVAISGKTIIDFILCVRHISLKWVSIEPLSDVCLMLWSQTPCMGCGSTTRNTCRGGWKCLPRPCTRRHERMCPKRGGTVRYADTDSLVCEVPRTAMGLYGSFAHIMWDPIDRQCASPMAVAQYFHQFDWARFTSIYKCLSRPNPLRLGLLAVPVVE